MTITIQLPALPDLPPADATPEVIAAYQRELDRFKAAAFALQAEAAGAMSADQTRIATEAEEFNEQQAKRPKPRRLDAAIVIAKGFAARTIPLTQGAPTADRLASDAKAVVDALAVKYPNAFED